MYYYFPLVYRQRFYFHFSQIPFLFSLSISYSCTWITEVNHSKWWINEWYVIMVFHLVPLHKEIYIYSKGTWTFKCHGWQCWLFRESCSAGMLNSWEGDVGFNLWLPRTGDMVVKRLKDAAAPRPNVVRSMKDLFLINSEPANELLL